MCAVVNVSLLISWVASPCDEEYINPSWMLMPVGNLVGEVAARPVSEDYIEWGWFMFGTGALMWLALWPITFCSVGFGCAYRYVDKAFRYFFYQNSEQENNCLPPSLLG